VVGDETYLYGEYNSTGNTTRNVTVGQEYYIRIRPETSSVYVRPYQIAINTGGIMLPSNAIKLTENYFYSPDNHSSSRWFEFTATASTQYIHIYGVYGSNVVVTVYDSSGTLLASLIYYHEPNTSLYKRISVTVTEGQEYYIRTQPHDSDYVAYNYKIGVNSTGNTIY